MNFNLNLSSVNGKSLDSEKLYDVIIIGGGPAGMSGAIYSARKGLSVGIIGQKLGGQVNDTSSVENYIGFEYISGEELALSFEKHMKSLDVNILTDEMVKSVRKVEKKFEIAASNYMTYKSKTVIVATGSVSRKLNVDGEDEFYGKGVTYCAICDGPLFKNKKVVVVGGGNSAVEAALDLSKISSEVILLHRSELRADQVLIEKLLATSNISVHLKTEINEIYGSDQVEGVRAYDKDSEAQLDIETSGVLVEIGYTPNTQFLEDIDLNSKKEIIVGANNRTSLSGLFAAGDVTNVLYKQIVIAAGEGAKAALSVNEYINNTK